MKKIMTLLIAMVAMFGLNSCDKEEGGIGNGSNEDPKEDAKGLPVFMSAFSEDLFKLYDINVTVYRNGKSQDICVNEGVVSKIKFEGEDCVRFNVVKVQDQLGVDSIKGTVTPKANIEETLKAMGKTQMYDAKASELKTVKLQSNGKFDEKDLEYFPTPGQHYNSSSMLVVSGTGRVKYEAIGEQLQSRFNKTK